MGSASDSLRNNDSYRAGVEPGQENIKFALSDKVSTISQADGNSQRLIMGKPVSRPHGKRVNENNNIRMGVGENDKDRKEATQAYADGEFKIKIQKYTPHIRNEVGRK